MPVKILHKDITVLLNSMETRNWNPDDYMIKGLFEISDKLHKLDEYNDKFLINDKIELTYNGKIEGDPPNGTVFYVCKYNDCGWCYAPTYMETTSCNGRCNKMSECKGRLK